LQELVVFRHRWLRMFRHRQLRVCHFTGIPNHNAVQASGFTAPDQISLRGPALVGKRRGPKEDF
jgi:hypothetical protein